MNSEYAIPYKVRSRDYYTHPQAQDIQPLESGTESSFFLRIIQGIKLIVFLYFHKHKKSTNMYGNMV